MFGPNPMGIQSIRLDFDDQAEATYYMQVEKEALIRIQGVGLDGLYRKSSSGWPAIARAVWADDNALLLEYSRGPGLEDMTWRIQFEGDRMLLETSGLTIEGKVHE